jgi:Type IX secretion system protein PorV
MKNYIFTPLLILSFSFIVKSQTSSTPSPVMSGLMLVSDARHGAMGETGVATSSDYGDMFWNPARTAFAENRFGFYSAYNPRWLRELVSDMSVIHLGAHYKLKNNKSAIAVSYANFRQGLFQSTNASGQAMANYSINDWLLGVNFAQKVSSKLSLGLGLKYLQSNLGTELSKFSSLGFNVSPASTIAADISVFYQDNNDSKRINFNYGVYVSNISGRVNYGGTESSYLPTNLKIGIAPTLNINKQNTLTLAIDANKLILPGQKVMWSGGAEYWYKKTLALRMGKFIESECNGGRNFTTFGLGTRIIKKINVDLAYLKNESQNSIHGDMWRGNITFGFGQIN